MGVRALGMERINCLEFEADHGINMNSAIRFNAWVLGGDLYQPIIQ